MKATATLNHPVAGRLPKPLRPLHDIAMNLRWSWDLPSQALFEVIDPERWALERNPMALLASLPAETAERLTDDEAFLHQMRLVHAGLTEYLETGGWFQTQKSPLISVAYFSPEFGVCEALPQYSGGLGVLAGDHLKASSDLGIPLTGVGLFYSEGYFRQAIDESGWQQERYLPMDHQNLSLGLFDDARVQVSLADKQVAARIWRADVGRVSLFLLDTDLEENDPDGRNITDRLYGGDQEHRIRQEIVLGIGGAQTLAQLGRSAQIFHMNEGHAGFLGLERIRVLMSQRGLSFKEACAAVRPTTAFTTHTSVPVGIDLFSRELMEKYFGKWAEDAGIDFEELMQLGLEPESDSRSPFNMAVMCLRLAGRSNGVSRLHGRVSRSIFRSIWPDLEEDQTPIGSITNGVHGPTWISPAMNELVASKSQPGNADSSLDWARVSSATDEDIWHAKNQSRSELVALVRRRMSEASAAGAGLDGQVRHLLGPDVLTLGFARRFAAYKRSTLMFSQQERLRALLLNPDRPVQLLLAGKAHPADEPGKQMIRQIVEFSNDPQMAHRVAFLPDYDMGVARALYQGADVWLNNPRRPLEACGTSGMKATLNATLNLSIPDGWWDEMCNPALGWTIEPADEDEDPEVRDKAEADRLFELLEQQIVPMFYDRHNGLPKQWISMMKQSVATLAPQLEATRMVREYLEQVYEPLASGDIVNQ